MPSSERNYYVVCDDNCRFPSMTSEQILEAIAEATGETPVHIDDAFISKLKEQNRNGQIKLWIGTNAEYNDIDTPESDVVYLITDSTEYDDLESAIRGVSQRLDGDETRLNNAESRLTVAETKIREEAVLYKKLTGLTTESFTTDALTFSTGLNWSSYNIRKTFRAESTQEGLCFEIEAKPNASIIGKKYIAQYTVTIEKYGEAKFYEKQGTVSGEVLNIPWANAIMPIVLFKEGVFSPTFLDYGNFDISVNVSIHYADNPTNLDCWDVSLTTSRIVEN